MVKTDILILGAGLTGLTLQYLLQKEGYQSILIEARNRIGGRILTIEKEGLPIEMGATWLGKKHRHLFELLKEMNLGTFPQELGRQAIYEPISTSPFQLVTLPENNEPSYRIKGGTATLINRLSDTINKETVILNQEVRSITNKETSIHTETNTQTFESNVVVSTIPPYLLKKSITFNPALPTTIAKLLSSTHTWMGESIKIGLTFDKPFWRESGTSGTVFSNVGPIPELYDHSNIENNRFALKGFLNGNYFSVTREDRKQLVINQLKKYFGSRIEAFTEYHELVWAKEAYTYTPYEHHVLPHQNNGHPLFQQSLFDGKFYIAGSETASAFSGYMDGAVRSAYFVKDQLKR